MTFIAVRTAPLLWAGVICQLQNASRVVRLGFFALLLRLLASATFAYTPPVGIPEPPFGIEETVASAYGSAIYYTYWIDNSHPNATDTGNPKGSPATPRLTIPNPLILTAGDVVQIRGGITRPYTPAGQYLNIYATGTVTMPVFVTAPTNARPTLTNAGVRVESGSYLIVEGLAVFDSAIGLSARDNIRQHHVAIRDCEVYGSGAYTANGIGIGEDASLIYTNNSISNVVIFRNYVHDGGDWLLATENDNGGIFFGARSRHIWILENTVCRAGGDGAGGGHNAQFTSDHLYIGRNTFFNNREDGIDIKQLNDVVISENRIWGQHVVDTSPGTGIVVHYNPTNFMIINNWISNCFFGIYIESVWTNFIVGNVILNTHWTNGASSPVWGSSYVSSAAIHANSVQSLHVINNTLVDYDNGITLSGNDDVIVRNNIFAGRVETNGFELLVGSLSGSTYQMDHNIFGYPTNKSRLGWTSAVPQPLSQVQRWGSLFDCAEVADVKFINDYRLQSTSVARDFGTNVITFERLRTYFGPAFAMDRDRTSRPRGQRLDAGAYEYAESFTGTPQVSIPEVTPNRAVLWHPATTNVTITTLTAGATIYWTTNGSTPTTNSSSGTAPLTLTLPGHVQLRAIATAPGAEPSFVGGGGTYYPQAITPVISPTEGAVPLTLTIASATPGATIWYTTNDAVPTGAEFSGPSPVTLNLTSPRTVRAIAYALGQHYENSGMASAVFVAPKSQTPVFSPNGGAFRGSVNVTITASNTGAFIYYTLDGSAPWTNGVGKPSPCVLTNLNYSATLKAISWVPGSTLDPSFEKSALFEASYCDAPVISPANGSVPITVSVTCATPNSIISWTTNGTFPDGNSAIIYWNPPRFTFTAPTTLRTRAYSQDAHGWGPETSATFLGNNGPRPSPPRNPVIR